MNSIVKTFFGAHLDLDKVIAISDVKIRSLSDTVYFTIDVAFRDEPILYDQNFDAVDDTEWVCANPEQARKELQAKVDKIVEQWKLWTRNKQIEDRMALVVKNNFIETQYPEEAFK